MANVWHTVGSAAEHPIVCVMRLGSAGHVRLLLAVVGVECKRFLFFFNSLKLTLISFARFYGAWNGGNALTAVRVHVHRFSHATAQAQLVLPCRP